MIQVCRVSPENAQYAQNYFERDLTMHSEWGILTMLGFNKYILYAI